jgi:hypothetical protein
MKVCVPLVNICEHCPNFRSEASFLPVLQLQRADAEVLAADAESPGHPAAGYPQDEPGLAG